MIFLENRLPADNSHEILAEDSHEICLILLFLKKQQNLKLSPANYNKRFMD